MAGFKIGGELKEVVKKTKLGIGFPAYSDDVPRLFFFSWCLLQKPEFELLTPPFTYYPTDVAKCREHLCEAAIATGCTKLLMMDTDQIYYTSDMIPVMLSYGKKIIGANVYRRWPPFDVVARKNGQAIPDEIIDSGRLIEVDRIGAGCIMFDLDVLKDIEKPWFEQTVRWDEARQENVQVGEDYNFCDKLKAAGHSIWLDCSVNISHIGRLQVNKATRKIYNALSKAREKENKGLKEPTGE